MRYFKENLVIHSEKAMAPVRVLQYSCLENRMDGGAWWAAVHGVARNQTRLSDFTFTFHFHALEKEVATHSSVLAWRIPGTEEPGGLPSMGSHRVRHDWSDLAAAAAAVWLPVYFQSSDSFTGRELHPDNFCSENVLTAPGGMPFMSAAKNQLHLSGLTRTNLGGKRLVLHCHSNSSSILFQKMI